MVFVWWKAVYEGSCDGWIRKQAQENMSRSRLGQMHAQHPAQDPTRDTP